MTDDTAFEPVNILLSRDELLVTLGTLQVQQIPGLDPDPLGERSPEQQTLALTVAARGLLARQLAQVKDDGELALHYALLTIVGICAYSQGAVFAYHWPAGAETPTRFFGHTRAGDFATHTRPVDVLHLFTLIPSREQFVNQALAACQFEDVPQAAPWEFTVAAQAFSRAREAASNGDEAGAVRALADSQAPEEGATALVATWASSPRVSILQTLKQEGDVVRKRDFTVLQGGQQAWLVAQIAGDAEEAPLLVKTTTRPELQSLLTQWI